MSTSLDRGPGRLPHRAPRYRSRKKQACRLRVERLEDRCLLSVDQVLNWNAITLQAEANDYDPAIVSSPDQDGPTRTARAFAIESAGVYDAVNSIDGSYAPYLARIPHARGASIDAAAAQAAHDTLVALFPKQQALFDAALTESLAQIPDGAAKRRGIAVGREAAANILADRANDGSNATMSYIPYPYPGYHQVDPDHPNQGFLSPQWGEVRPFVLGSSNQFRAPDVGLNPQARLAFLNSPQYTAAYNQVRFLGERNSSVRTPEQTQTGIFWSYDGSPDIGTPPRSFDQVTAIIATDRHNTEVQNARLFALVNLAIGDAAIAAWESKYFYNFWRPIVGIRNADSTGNPDTVADPDWSPLGAQADNGSGTNFTPPFPSYVSGHATFAGAVFQALRDFYGTDNVAFSFQSDEYNGVTRDDTGMVRPPVTRSYTTLSQPEQEVHDSRIYLGVHWLFDQDAGDAIGRSVGDYVFDNALQPVGRGAPDASMDNVAGADLVDPGLNLAVGLGGTGTSLDPVVGHAVVAAGLEAAHGLAGLQATAAVSGSAAGGGGAQTHGPLATATASSQVLVARPAGSTEAVSTTGPGEALSARPVDQLLASSPDPLRTDLGTQALMGVGG
jgi:hypothetical protein